MNFPFHTLVALALVTASAATRATPPPPANARDWWDAPDLYAWGPEVNGTCRRSVWQQGKGWRALPPIPFACPTQEAVFTGWTGVILRWNGSALVMEADGRFAELALPAGVGPSFEIGFECHDDRQFILLRDAGVWWALRLTHDGRFSTATSWEKHGPRPQLDDFWSRRDVVSAAQAITNQRRLRLESVAGTWRLEGSAVSGLPAETDWVAFAPQQPTRDVGADKRRTPVTPPNRAVILRRRCEADSCAALAPVYLARGNRAVAIDGPTGEVFVSQLEATVVVVDRRGLWLVDARTGAATLTEGVVRTLWYP